jgi:hypothetical protein
MKARSAALLVLCSSFTTAAAFAQPPSESLVREAEQRFNEGRELLKQRKWSEARSKFLQACAVNRTMNCPKNLGAAEYELGMFAEATTHFEEFLRNNNLPDNDPNVVGIRKFYETAFAKSGHLEITAPDGATVSIDGTTIGKAPLGNPVHVTPGPHELRAALTDGRSTSFSTEAEAGRIVKVSLVPSETPPTAALTTAPTPAASGASLTPPPPQTDKSSDEGTGSTRTTLGIAVAGAGVLSLVTGIVFGVISSSKASSAESFLVQNPTACANRSSSTCGIYESKLDDAQTAKTTSHVFYVATGALAIGAVILLWPRSDPQPTRRTSTWIVPIVGPGGSGVQLGGSF